MTRYLPDTNHLGAGLNDDAGIRERLQDYCLRGDRVGTCIPVLCELQAGILLTARREQNERLLRELLKQIRVWPLDHDTALLYGELYHELRRSGRVLSQVDIMLAALARQTSATVVTTDRDFEGMSGIKTVSWMPA